MEQINEGIRSNLRPDYKTLFTTRVFLICSCAFVLIIYLSLVMTYASWESKLTNYPVLYNNQPLGWNSDNFLAGNPTKTLFQYKSTGPDTVEIEYLPSVPAFSQDCDSDNCTSLSQFMPIDYTFSCSLVFGGNLIVPVRRPKLVTLIDPILHTNKTIMLSENSATSMSVSINSMITGSLYTISGYILLEMIYLGVLVSGKVAVSMKSERRTLLGSAILRRTSYSVPLYIALFILVGNTEMSSLIALCFLDLENLFIKLASLMYVESAVSMSEMRGVSIHKKKKIMKTWVFMTISSLLLEMARVIIVAVVIGNYGASFSGFEVIVGTTFNLSAPRVVRAGSYSYLFLTFIFDVIFAWFMYRAYQKNWNVNNLISDDEESEDEEDLLPGDYNHSPETFQRKQHPAHHQHSETIYNADDAEEYDGKSLLSKEHQAPAIIIMSVSGGDAQDTTSSSSTVTGAGLLEQSEGFSKKVTEFFVPYWVLGINTLLESILIPALWLSFSSDLSSGSLDSC